MQSGWIRLLSDLGIDINSGGGADFAELVLRLINGYRWSGELPSVGEVARTMAKERGCSTLPLYREMKKAVRPLAAALQREGLSQKDTTCPAMALAIAEKQVELIQQRREPLPDKSTKGVILRKKSK